MWCRRETSCSSASTCKAAGDRSGPIKLWHHKQQHVVPIRDVRQASQLVPSVCAPPPYIMPPHHEMKPVYAWADAAPGGTLPLARSAPALPAFFCPLLTAASAAYLSRLCSPTKL